MTSHTEIDAVLAEWERQNPAMLTPEYRRGFFGAPNVANGKLCKKTSVHLVPAVRDATAENTDPKRSPILKLLSEISRQIFENKKEMVEFIERSQLEFSALADPNRVPQLSEISDHLTDSLQRFYADSKLTALWEHGEGLSVSYPVPRIAVEHRGVVTDLSRVGHGLQRAALFSIVQFLAEQVTVFEEGLEVAEFQSPASDIIILIEEPEIYQHPSKQLVIGKAFLDLSNAFNKVTGIRLQIIYTTHSEKFVNMANFESVRIVRIVLEEEEIKNIVSNLSLEKCIQDFANFFDPPRDPMSRDAFVAKLHIFTREVCEGFFANKVILVEGVTDRAILDAVYRSKFRDVNSESIAIISVEGKAKMDKPAYIFSNMGIPTYLVFDNDKKKNINHQKSDTNILLQKICGVHEPVEFPQICDTRFSAFETDLETYLRDRVSNLYQELFNVVADEYGLNYEQIKKTPDAISKVILLSMARGCTFRRLDEIIEKVDAL